MKEKVFSITKKDFEISTFKSGGPGGQHQNKTDSGVRIKHTASGAVGESRTHRSKPKNIKTEIRNTAGRYVEISGDDEMDQREAL